MKPTPEPRPEGSLEVYAAVTDVRMPLAAVPELARRAEALGFDGLLVPEAVQDGILVAALALEHTERLRVATGVVVAFARSPTLLAQDAWGLRELSGGRFELGLGSQVRANVEGRFGMPWSAPAARMRDYVGALRAVMETWQTGKPLRYESPSYRLTRMQPFFAPEPSALPPVPVLMGAVGPRMARVAGEVADGVLTHPTNSTPGYLEGVLRPALAEGARAAGRDPAAVRVLAGPMVATGASDDEVAAEREAARGVLAFTFSTPAYRASLDHHGWGDLHERLRERSRAGDWAGMASAMPDEVLDAMVPSARLDAIGAELRRRYVGVADAVTLRLPADPASEPRYRELLRELAGHAALGGAPGRESGPRRLRSN